MALAANLTEWLMEFIQERWAEESELVALVPRVYVDFAPEIEVLSETLSRPATRLFPAVVISQGEDGGTTLHASTGDIDEAITIDFDAWASTRKMAGQIAWQIVSQFSNWLGDSEKLRVCEAIRSSPPVVRQIDEGVGYARVSVVFSVVAVDTS